jgi:hypothetical protein
MSFYYEGYLPKSITMHFIVTGADHVSNTSIRKERYVEYMLALHRIFSYNAPVLGVLSEYDPSEQSPPFSRFPFKLLKTIARGILDGLGKSQKEYASISRLLSDVIGVSDDDFIIKVSGRYMLVNDTFVNLVKEHETNPRVNAIIRLCDQDTQQYTFLYAMRYKYFKQLHSQPMFAAGINIEQVTLDFIRANGLFDTTIKVKSLGILANINNENSYTIY